MIYGNGNKELVSRRKLVYPSRWKVATEIYKGTRLVWTAIKSCFGAGYWINDKPWLDTEGWKN